MVSGINAASGGSWESGGRVSQVHKRVRNAYLGVIMEALCKSY